MSRQASVHAAAQNNAEWCHAFSLTHGMVGRFEKALWSSSVRTPPYYPDAVTLLPEATVEAVLSGIDTGEGCSAKDSFACLDFGAAGFRPLFRAEWLAREPAESRVTPPRGWSAVTTAARLSEWESAWGEEPGGSGFFRPDLLADATIRVLARYDGGCIVAEAVSNRSTTVIGLSKDRRPGLPARKSRAQAVRDLLGREAAWDEVFAVVPRREWRNGLDH